MHHHRVEVRQAAAQHRKDERGASAIEYALLLALIAVVVFGAVSFFGTSNGGGFTRSASCINVAYGGAKPVGCN